MDKNEAAAILDLPLDATPPLIKAASILRTKNATTATEKALFTTARQVLLGEDLKTDELPKAPKQQSQKLPSGVKKGTIKWYNPEKEFGFVIDGDTKGEIFFTTRAQFNHNISSLELQSGQDVFFEIIIARDGRPAATNMATHPYNGRDSPTPLPPPAKRLTAPPKELPQPPKRIAKT